MIYVSTNLNTADNSGARYVKCIKILSKKMMGTIGDLILVSLKKINPKKKLLKGTLHQGVIVRVHHKVIRSIGYILINDNSLVVLNKTSLPIGSRILGPIFRELRFYKKYNKIISLSSYVV